MSEDNGSKKKPLRIVSWAELSQRIPYSRQHVARLEKAGRFPPRFALNPESGTRGRKGWLSQDIDAFIEARAALRQAPKPE